ncbi:alpha-1,3-mannosyl-glycoprotein 4-beta-N-acetylglucosaminyltransferase B [Lingula anatina]|uniref:Alpha-1,3-mannosyl-glycoprotein 4-beta-N-acetylglucosaminyltransferase B n=1 Tax=Lingula anatina TaxID=7574 RepID=A0A1S3IVW2_LINAN|nr:alpha-1,3-mannosyl-glycoprotein 4-beta-N-acetylglucosaminyltransferase B [Lingula anatina]|eukprot:XP_013402330.1 alpha-1,3-mannosyl-glycoprotein 4-beta-N-acetylglucosaminyltransferase B [Lingula anatina]
MRFRLKNVVFLSMLLLFMPFLALFVGFRSGLSREQLMHQRITELSAKLLLSEKLGKEKQSAYESLRRQFSSILQNKLRDSNDSSISTALRSQYRDLLTSLSYDAIRPPDMFHELTHLNGRIEALSPAFRISRGRTGVSIVVGIPSVKREKNSYLLDTLRSLVDNLNEEEKNDTLLVVLIAEPYDVKYIQSQAELVKSNFPDEVGSGLIEVLGPSASYYPDLDSIKETLGDSKERTRWRSKQNLDFVYLWMYARTRGTYYVQLEDDVMAKSGYVTIMKNFALSQKTDDWLLLEFSYLGFIGKMFKSADLPYLIEFILMFYTEKPIDWLLDHYLFVKLCSPEKDAKYCDRMKSSLRRRFKPSLFQHVGMHSSLKGKVQKLKDKDFGKAQLHHPHTNPPAEVSTTIEKYQKYSLDDAYLGLDFFWGTFPKAGDMCIFRFNPPIALESFYFKSGNPEHPGDQLYNTTVEIMPYSHTQKQDGILTNDVNYQQYNRTNDGYLIMGEFVNSVAKGDVGAALGPILELRLHVKSESKAWVILSEIYIKPLTTS